VELSPRAALELRASQPELRLVPVVYYTPAVAPRAEITTPIAPAGARARAAAAAGAITVQVVSKKTAAPVANAFVVAFVDFAAGTGAQGATDANGNVSLNLGGSSVKVQRLYVYPLDANWSLIKKNVTLTNGTKITVTPLDLGYKDGLRYFYGDADVSVGSGVTVGVVDTGCGPHPDLVIAGGANTVAGEDPKDFSDNGKAHGTHVAGIIAARGTPPKGLRGVAPGVTLRAYRVFGKGQGSADSFAIAKAVDQAVADKCDLINMSLGGGQPDPVLKAAIDDARAGGAVCIIAAGNDSRGPVSFPAFEDSAVAVTATGRKGTFPTSATEADDVAAPYGTDKANFVASFSNVGPQVDLTGPGVAIMSTVPSGYAEISGTSMACPAETGAAARVIAGTSVIKGKRDANRSAAIVKAILSAATSLGFGPNFEGHGVIEVQ
jgi:subtilisin